MKRIWNRICAMLLVCAVLAAFAPAALADDGADAYRIAVSAVPAVVAAGGSTTVSATVYCPDAVCVSFRQPDASAGRLLKEFRSVAGGAYTTVRYAQERFYLADAERSEPLLDGLFFLLAADCASQLKLGYTAYDNAGTQLGTGELTVRVASKQSSAVFSDVNAGSCAWAAAAVDFMN